MPDRKGAAIGIDALPWECAKIEIDARLLAAIGGIGRRLDGGEHLCCEGFVDFPKRNVGKLELVARQQTRSGAGGRHATASTEERRVGKECVSKVSSRVWRN